VRPACGRGRCSDALDTRLRLRLPAPDPVVDLDDDGPGVSFALAHITQELGDREFAELIDDSDRGLQRGGGSPWTSFARALW
jgi:hypothetical protein